MDKCEKCHPGSLSPLGAFGMWKSESWRSGSLLSGNIIFPALIFQLLRKKSWPMIFIFAVWVILPGEERPGNIL